MKNKIIVITFVTMFAAGLFATETETATQPVADPTVAIAAIRVSLDSIEVEVQGRKRLGQPISDLEQTAALLRDSLAALRERAEIMRGEGTLPPPQEEPEKKSFWSQITDIIPQGVLTFRPKDIFDWVIVITGGVALLCAILLFIGLIVVRRKPKAEKNAAKKSDVRKMNLAPQTVPKMKKVEDAIPAPPLPPRERGDDVGSSENLQSLVDHLRKLSPQGAQTLPPSTPMSSTPATAMSSTPATPASTSSALTAEQSVYTPPPPPPQRPAPPPPPTPLFVNVTPPDESAVPPPSESGGKIDVQVFAAADAGMSEFEIAKRYKMSIDEVKLMLRMKRF